MTTIVSTEYSNIIENSAVSLARYAQILRIPECQFWGVNPQNLNESDCGAILTLDDRKLIARYLNEAQLEIEKELRYFLNPKYVTGNLGYDYLLDDRPIKNTKVITRWGKLLQLGRKVTTDLGLYAVDHTNDPAIVGPIVSDDYTELHIYYPDTLSEINPSNVIIGVGTVTFEIPRCRMAADQDNDSSGWDYNNTALFLSEVQITQETMNTTNPVDLVAEHGCNLSCDCSEYTSAVCGKIVDGRLGIIRVGTGSNCCYGYSRARLNYKAGLDPLDSQAEDTLIRLAHTKMPVLPCACGYAKFVWERDRQVSNQYMATDRLNCPFGLMDGAWIAWRWTEVMRLVRPRTL